ncbi:MAG: sugar kinase [Hydrogenophilaceae bacterium]|nr:sugar kinase [Hydrogenophilaceae bacterium]
MRKDGRIVAFGEILIRLSAPGAEWLLQSKALEVAFGGAEANVAVSLARFGHDVRMLSFAPDNALGRAACEELRRYGVDVDGVKTAAGRMGLYFLTPGAGPRAAEVLYDRAGSAFARADFDAIDWAEALAGAGLLHVSGVTAALGPEAARGVQRAVREARRLGVAVSFDCNYRAKLWEAWNGNAARVLKDILAHADIVFGDHRDIALALGRTFAADEARDRHAAAEAFAAFPQLGRIAHTTRVQHSANHNELSATLYARDGVHHAPGMDLTHIVDRIGAGDAFAAGLLHGLRSGMEDGRALSFALAAACLKHVTPGDFNLARVGDVEAMLERGLEVRR